LTASSVLEVIHAFEKKVRAKLPHKLVERRAGDVTGLMLILVANTIFRLDSTIDTRRSTGQRLKWEQ
jgi:UDP-glucose 4-epimerase